MTKKIVTFIALVFLNNFVFANNEIKEAPYPAPLSEQKRYVIYLPNETEEENLKVELQAIKDIMKDCNKQRAFSKLNKKTLEGWGYDYYVIEDVIVAGTRMMCRDKPTLQPINISLGDGAFLKYNSKLPIVVYTPKDVKLNYVIWGADKVFNTAEEK